MKLIILVKDKNRSGERGINIGRHIVNRYAGTINKSNRPISYQNSHALPDGTAENSRTSKHRHQNINYHSKNNDTLHQHQFSRQHTHALSVYVIEHINNTYQYIKGYSNTENDIGITPKAMIEPIGHANCIQLVGSLLPLDNKEINDETHQRNDANRIKVCLQCSRQIADKQLRDNQVKKHAQHSDCTENIRVLRLPLDINPPKARAPDCTANTE